MKMKNGGKIRCYIFCLLALVMASCSRDPVKSRNDFTASGDKYFKGEKFKEAIIEYRNAIQATPQYPPTHYKVALAYLKAKELRAAFEHLSLLVSFDQNKLEAAFQDPGFGLKDIIKANTILGEIYFQSKKTRVACELLNSTKLKTFSKEASEELKKSDDKELRKNLVGCLSLKAKVFSTFWKNQETKGTDKLATAFTALKKAVRLKQSLQGLYLLFADIINFKISRLKAYPLKGKPGERESKDLIAAVNSQDENPVPKLVLAEYYRKTALLEKKAETKDALMSKVRSELKKALRCDEIRSGKLTELDKAVENLTVKGTKSVERIYQDIISQVPDNSAFKLTLAFYYCNLRDQGKALSWFKNAQMEYIKKAMAVDPSALLPKLVLARYYGQNQEYKKAEEIIVNAARAHPGDYAPKLELASFYEERARSNKDSVEKKKLLALAEKTLKEAVACKKDELALYIKLGSFYERQNNIKEAENVYRQMVNIDPENPASQRVLGIFLARYNKKDKAVEPLKRACKLAPEDESIQNLLATVYLEKGDIEKAKEIVDKILGKKDSKGVNFNTLFVQARIAYSKKEYDKTEKLLDKILLKRPDHPGAHYYRALLYLRDNKIEKAKEEFLASLKSNPRRLKTHLSLARLYLLESDADKALTHLNYILGKDPENYKVTLLKGNAYILKKDNEKAKEVYLKATKLAPDNPEAFFRLALVSNLQRNDDETLRLLNKVLYLQSDFFSAIALKVSVLLKKNSASEALSFLNGMILKHEDKPARFKAMLNLVLGNVLLLQQSLQKSEEAFKKSIDLDPELIGPYLSLARLYALEGKAEKAISEYKSILKKKPKYTKGLMALGAIYEAEGNIEEACSNYEKVLAVSPDFVPAANNLAWLLLQSGKDPARALKLSEKAKNSLPNNAAVRDTFGAALLVNGLYGSALHELLSSFQKMPENPVIRYHLALAYFLNGRKYKGIENLAKSLEGMFIPDFSSSKSP